MDDVVPKIIHKRLISPEERNKCLDSVESICVDVPLVFEILCDFGIDCSNESIV